MIFFKKTLVLKIKPQNTVCGYINLTNNEPNTTGTVKITEIDNNETFSFTAESNGKIVFDKAISGESLNDYKFFIPNYVLDEKLVQFSLKKHEAQISQSKEKNNEISRTLGREKELNELETSNVENLEKNEKLFFESVREKVEKMFEENKPFPLLEKKISDSKWVKVNFDESGLYYVLGLIYKNAQVQYVCYGIPSHKDEKPPKQIEDYCKFTQTSENGDGFYIMKQNALNGECEK